MHLYILWYSLELTLIILFKDRTYLFFLKETWRGMYRLMPRTVLWVRNYSAEGMNSTNQRNTCNCGVRRGQILFTTDRSLYCLTFLEGILAIWIKMSAECIISPAQPGRFTTQTLFPGKNCMSANY